LRRAAATLIGTLAGTALLVGAKFGAHTPGDAAALTAGAVTVNGGPAAGTDDGPSATASTAASGPPSGGPSGTPAASGAPGTVPTPGRTAPGSVPTTAAGAPKTTGPAAPPPTTAGSGLKNGSYTASASEKYGTVTLTITISGGKLTNASASYAASSSESQQISANAFPKLRQEALAAQSANIASVSGATYTSSAYKSSLQAALNAAHA
jgi:uncharacterized protein with FMN-binding domain